MNFDEIKYEIIKAVRVDRNLSLLKKTSTQSAFYYLAYPNIILS